MRIHGDAIPGVVRFAGVDVGFHDNGDPSGPPPIVLVHGTGGSTLDHFRTVYPMLAARHRVIGIDFGSAKTLDDLVGQVGAVVDERASDGAAHLVGFSLGAAVAATAVARGVVAAERLTMLCGWATSDHVQRARYGLWRRLFAGDQDALRIYSTLMGFGWPYLTARSESELTAMIQGREFAAGIDDQMRINETLDVSSLLPRIGVPTLVVGGVYDQMVPLKHSRMIFGAIDDARLAEIPTGHGATTERPAQVFKLIDDFTRDLPHTRAAGAVLDTATI